MGDWLGIGTAAGGAIGAGLSLVGQKKREERAVGNQMRLNKQGRELGMQTWHETNVGPQMEKYKEAGLNPALMYGQGGAGGGTVGSPSGGSAPAPQPMEIGSMVAAGKLAAETALLGAQKKNVDADTELKGAETGLTGQKTLNSQQEFELLRIENYIKENTKDLRVEEVERQVDNLISTGNLTDQQVTESKERVVLMGIDGVLKNSQVAKNKEETWAIAEKIMQEGQKISAMMAQVGVGAQANTLRGIEGKAELKKMGIQMVQFALGNELEWSKLTQKQVSDIMDLVGMLGLGGAVGKLTEPATKAVKGFRK